MPPGCALVRRSDWIFSDLHAGQSVRGAVFPAGEEGFGRSGRTICARRILESAHVASPEHSSAWAALFGAGTGEENHRAGTLVGAADGTSEGKGFPAVWRELK